MRDSFIIVIVFLAFLACKKEDKFVKATISDETMPLSGCGWVVVANSELFSPQNLPEAYKVNGLDVEIKYEVQTSRINCQLHDEGMYEIVIKDIRFLND